MLAPKLIYYARKIQCLNIVESLQRGHTINGRPYKTDSMTRNGLLFFAVKLS